MITENNIILLSFIAAIIKLLLASYICFKDYKSKVNILFSLIFLFQGIWDLGKGFMWLSDVEHEALIFGKVSYAAYIISVFLFAHFCWVYLRRRNIFSGSGIGLAAWYFSMAVLVASLFFTPFVIEGIYAPGEVDIGFGLSMWMYNYGLMYNYFFFIFQMLPFLYGFIIFIHKYIVTSDNDLKKRLVYFILGTSFPILIGIPTGVILPFVGIQLPPHNNLLSLIMSFFLAIGIIKYKLLSVAPSLEKINPKLKFPEDIKSTSFNYGSSYLIENPDSVDTAYLFFLFNIYKGNYGFIITSSDPSILKQKYGLANTPVIRVTGQETNESSFAPRDIEQIFSTVESFMLSVKNSFVIIDCFDTLKKYNNFRKVHYFIRRLGALAKDTGACLIVPRGSLILTKKENMAFKSSFTYISSKGRMSSLAGSIISMYRHQAKERFIVLGYTSTAKSLLHEFSLNSIPCTLVALEKVHLKYPHFIKILQQDPLLKDTLSALSIDAPSANIIISFDNDAKAILCINLVRSITDKAKLIAEVKTDKYVDIAKKAGANEAISASTIGGKFISLSLTSPNVVEWFMDSLISRNRSLDLVELLVSPGSPLKGKTVSEAGSFFRDAANILSVSKQSTLDLTTDKNYLLRENDRLVVLLHTERAKKNKIIRKMFGIK